MDEWIKQMWYINEMEYYLAIKKEQRDFPGASAVKNPPAWEGGSGWGAHVNPWLIHFNV